MLSIALEHTLTPNDRHPSLFSLMEGTGGNKLIGDDPRRGDRVVEGARLESVCAGKTGAVGSNPTLSAIYS